MNKEIQLLRSKINLLNGQLAGIHDSHLFTPEERAELTAPLAAQVQELHARLLELANPDQQHPVFAQTPNPKKQPTNAVH